MLKISIAAGLLATSFAYPAGAVVLGPETASALAGNATSAIQVAWVCGPRRCVWRPGWRGPVPRFAIWGPPRLPGCVYELRRRAWVEICV
jgi:hypothetical protein